MVRYARLRDPVSMAGDTEICVGSFGLGEGDMPSLTPALKHPFSSLREEACLVHQNTCSLCHCPFSTFGEPWKAKSQMTS